MGKNTIIEKIAHDHRIRLTEQRRNIIEILIESEDHPSIDEIYMRIQKINPQIGIATIYRNISLLEKCGAIRKLEIGIEKKARYEIAEANEDPHEHLIDTETGEIIEFSLNKKEIETIYREVGEQLGYFISDHKFQLFGKKIK